MFAAKARLSGSKRYNYSDFYISSDPSIAIGYSKEAWIYGETGQITNRLAEPINELGLLLPDDDKNYVDRRTYGGTVYKEISYGLWKEIERITHNRKIMLDYTDPNTKFEEIPVFNDSAYVKDIARTIREFLGINPP